MTVCLCRHSVLLSWTQQNIPRGYCGGRNVKLISYSSISELRMSSFTSTLGFALPVFHLQNVTYNFKYINTEKNSLFPRDRFTFLWFITAIHFQLHTRFIYSLAICLPVRRTYFTTLTLNITESKCHIINNLMTHHKILFIELRCLSNSTICSLCGSRHIVLAAPNL
jgi:hypothetical protein